MIISAQHNVVDDFFFLCCIMVYENGDDFNICRLYIRAKKYDIHRSHRGIYSKWEVRSSFGYRFLLISIYIYIYGLVQLHMPKLSSFFFYKYNLSMDIEFLIIKQIYYRFGQTSFNLQSCNGLSQQDLWIKSYNVIYTINKYK